MHRVVSLLALAVVILSVTAGSVNGAPPPIDEGNGLSANESATLWSRDTDDYVNESTYRDWHSRNRTLMAELANGTDITFKRPPKTAAVWTRNDFQDLEPGGPDVSVYPRHADRAQGTVIKDAHATIFAIHPSTRGHLDVDKTPLYVAPKGTIRALIDYRLVTPTGHSSDPISPDEVLSHEVTEVRLKQDEAVIATASGTRTPALNFKLNGSGKSTLTLEADMQVRVRAPRNLSGNENHTSRLNRTESGVVTETITVSDSIPVTVYDLDAYVHYASYPTGETGVAIFQTQPWQGYTLTDDGSARVRGVWRFYTARNPNWDRLTRASHERSTEVDSPALPVFVHAYPSRIGPRAEPVRDGPRMLSAWGIERPSPNETVGENVTIDIVDRPYETSYGIAVSHDTVDRKAIRVSGIVRGVNATIAEPNGGMTRPLRRSTLSVTKRSQNESATTLRIELRDRETGEPIRLADPTRRELIDAQPRDGYITVAGKRVETNASGVAMVTVRQPGVYTAEYHPGSWLSQDPAYMAASATVRWHPLTTPAGWFSFLIEVSWQLIPFGIAYYAGTHLLRIFGITDLLQE